MSALVGTEDVQILNRMLGDRLGLIDGRFPRFAWKWAPDQPWFVFGLDDRTLVKRCWADMAAPDGRHVGRAWVMAQWRRSRVVDHHGFGSPCAQCNGEGYRFGRVRCQACNGNGRITGMRIPFVKEFDYAPYLETIVGDGQVPTAELTANYCWAIARQLAESIEEREDAFERRMGEEAWTIQQNDERDKIANRERSAAEYDKYTGAFGNLEPGNRDGFLSFQNSESGPEVDDGFYS